MKTKEENILIYEERGYKRLDFDKCTDCFNVPTFLTHKSFILCPNCGHKHKL